MKIKSFILLFLFILVGSTSIVMARMRDCDIDDCYEDSYTYQYQYQTPEYAYPTPAYESPYEYPTPPPSCSGDEHLVGDTCVPNGIEYATPYAYPTPPYDSPYQTPGGTGQGGTWLNMNFVVKDQNGNGVSGVLVTIGRDDGNGSTRITDGGGFANFGVFEKQVISWTAQSGACGSTSGTLYFDTSENWAFPKLNCPGGYPTPYETPAPPDYDYQTPGEVGYQTPPANLPCKDVRATNFNQPLPCKYVNNIYPTPPTDYPTPGTGYQTPGSSYQTPSAYTLNVDAAGGGNVSSQDGFINCGADCSKSYPINTNVIIHASPRSSYWKFTGWSGDCSGTGDCTLKMNSTKTVSGQFVPRIFQYKEF